MAGRLVRAILFAYLTPRFSHSSELSESCSLGNINSFPQPVLFSVVSYGKSQSRRASIPDPFHSHQCYGLCSGAGSCLFRICSYVSLGERCRLTCGLPDWLATAMCMTWQLQLQLSLSFSTLASQPAYNYHSSYRKLSCELFIKFLFLFSFSSSSPGSQPELCGMTEGMKSLWSFV